MCQRLDKGAQDCCQFENMKSLIYQHTRQTEHHFDFDNTKVLQQQKSTSPSRILKSIYSNLNPTAINRCYQLPQQYNVISYVNRLTKFIL